MQDALEQAAAWRAAGRGVALATVVSTWGSSPRPPGSQLAVDESGAMVGSVSGGCIEGAVVQAALEVIGGGAARLLEFGVSNDLAWSVGLACGGKVQVYVAAASEIINEIMSLRGQGRPAVLAIDLQSGEQQLVAPEAPAARRALDDDRSAAVDGVFYQVFNTPLRLWVVGAVHVAQALARMAAAAGFEVLVIDPRRAFATEERFPGVSLVTSWPDEALAQRAPDRRTAVVTLTHDPKLDDPALAAALRSPAYYVGALGSKKTHAARLQRLREAGFGDTDLERIHGPVGLDIGARTPEEIAVSILADVIATLRRESA